ncbi:MAG: hypothetical protein CL609_14725 [Anaerolineaceae bacterium]|nr:hypothetical protein [Anaerolineaceae bacterium]
MKTLLLMRHAKSSWKNTDLADHERPLKKKGRKDTVLMAKQLKKKDLIPDLIYSSSAIRATETLEILLDSLKFDGKAKVKDVLYMAEPDTIIDKINSVNDDIDKLLIIGHNPGLESLTQILGDKIDALPTGAIAVIVLPINKWSELNAETEGELANLWTPAEFRKKD